jgi:hypothetical protein
MRRLVMLTVLCLLLFVSFSGGVILTLRMVVPFAAILGLANVASVGANQMIDVLLIGKSSDRMQVLTALSQHFHAPNAAPPDAATWKFLEPGLQACTTDPDPAVAKLAADLLETIFHIQPSQP